MPRHTEADRALARRHVMGGEARIEELRVRIARGRANQQAEEVLATMLRTLENMRQHLAIIEADLDGTEPPPFR